jgi:hypothetical protein
MTNQTINISQLFLEFSSIRNASRKENVLQKKGTNQKVQTFVQEDQAGSATDRSTGYCTFGQLHSLGDGMQNLLEVRQDAKVVLLVSDRI